MRCTGTAGPTHLHATRVLVSRPSRAAALDLDQYHFEGIALLQSSSQPLAEIVANELVQRGVVMALRKTFSPAGFMVLDGAPSAELARLVPLATEKTLLDGKATAYVCEQQACKRPTNDVVEEFTRQLGAKEPAERLRDVSEVPDG